MKPTRVRAKKVKGPKKLGTAIPYPFRQPDDNSFVAFSIFFCALLIPYIVVSYYLIKDKLVGYSIINLLLGTLYCLVLSDSFITKNKSYYIKNSPR